MSAKIAIIGGSAGMAHAVAAALAQALDKNLDVDIAVQIDGDEGGIKVKDGCDEGRVSEAMAIPTAEELMATVGERDAEIATLRNALDTQSQVNHALRGENSQLREDRLALRGQVMDFMDSVKTAKAGLKSIKAESCEVSTTATATDCLNRVNEAIEQWKVQPGDLLELVEVPTAEAA